MKYKSVIFCLIIGELMVIGATANENHSVSFTTFRCAQLCSLLK